MEKCEGVVTSKGHLVIPAKLRLSLRIGRGTRVRFKRIKGGIGIYPDYYKDGIEHYHGILAGLGLPEDIEREPDREIR